MFTKEIHNIFVGLLLTLLIFASTPSSADDTAIFFTRDTASEQINPNVLLMLDNSGSMLETDEDLNGFSRIEVVKQATVKLIRDTRNVNLGLGSFGGHLQGGTIRYPVSELDKDVCENLTCDSISLRNRVETHEDDGEEDIDSGDMRRIRTSVPFLVDNIAGLRFDNIKFPRGARLISARLEVSPTFNTDRYTEIQIQAEAIGDSPIISNDDFDLSRRTRTLAQTDWVPEVWDKNLVYSVDILPVVSEVLGRTDWCGGNAMTLLAETSTGRRFVHSTDPNEDRQPVLKLEYDPSTVDFNDTCLTQESLVGISQEEDDAVETIANGAVDTSGGDLLTELDGELNLLGFRFNGVEIPRAAKILSAQLKLQSNGFTGEKLSASVFGESTGDSAAYDDARAYGISSRGRTGAAVSWDDINQLGNGNILESPDLTSIIQEIVFRGDWDSGNSLSLMLKPTSNIGSYLFGAFEDEDAQSAQLFIEYQVDESSLAGTPVVLKTARDELIDEVFDLRVGSFTPIVDMLYEGAQYFLGAPVQYGATRGTGAANVRNAIQKVAHEDSYTGGELFQPPNCSDVDLNNVACTGERINGDPVYQPPEASACLANNIVMLTDGEAVRNTSKGLVQELTGESDCAARDIADEECGLELADWMSRTDHDSLTPGDQGIVLHTIGFNITNNFLTDLASFGGGQFHTVDNTEELSNAFQVIVTDAADLSTSFVAPAVSVSQLNTLSNSDEIFYAMFRPQLTAAWDGNLKRYTLGEYNGETTVVDALGAPAIDNDTGSITSSAQSYWSGFRDGDNVAEGGAASQLPQSRTVYTFQPDATGANSIENFHESNTFLNASTLGLTDDSYLTDLVQWARGVDVKDFDGDGDVAEVRAQMGDPLHSIPQVINYAEGDDVKSVIFVGTNEGFLHAINTETGVEEYAIIPPELLPNLDTYYQDNAFGRDGRLYGLDGEVVGWIDGDNGNRVVDDGESAFLVVGMRRGGSNYYAFNVTDPENPEVAWVIRNTDPGFSELGQTWSRPIKSKLKVGGEPTDVLIFSGGYDPIADKRNGRFQRRFPDTQGRAIFIVNANTGELITSYDRAASGGRMNWSIASTPRVIDINFDGLADYLFVGDMGGRIWRLDFVNATSADNFEMYGGIIADMALGAWYANRHFYYEPDVAVLTDENNNQYLNIAIGSGWRANPLNTRVQDRMYVFRDYAIYGPPRDEFDVVKYPFLRERDLYDATNSDTSADTSGRSQKGFFIKMETRGEKIVSAAFTVNSNLLFTSYVPGDANDVCQASVGSSRFYAIDARNAESILNLDGTLTEEGAKELGLGDRKIDLNTPGIAPGPNVLFPGGGKDPVVLVGLEEPEGTMELDIGNSFKKTFWAQPEIIE